MRMALAFYAALLGLAAGIGLLTGHSLVFASPVTAARGIDWGRDPGIGLLAGAAVVALSAVLTEATRWGEALARALAELLGPLSARDCLVLAAVSGVAEEALFRGAIQPHAGLVMASLLFGLAHFVPRRDLLPWSAFALAAGFGLGALYQLTGNLVAPIVAHAVVNGVNLRLLTRRFAS